MKILHCIYTYIKQDIAYTKRLLCMLYNIPETYTHDVNEILMYYRYMYTDNSFELSEYNIFNIMEKPYEYICPLFRVCIYIMVILGTIYETKIY
jgi:hypothetical protein